MTKLALLLATTPMVWWLAPIPPTTSDAAAPLTHIAQTHIPAGVDVHFYDVYGDSAQELRASIDQRKPQRWDGYTQWRVGWSWPGYGRADCRLDQARLRTWISVSLPRWQPSNPPEPELEAQWNTFIQQLSEHERQHVAIVQSGFAAMRQALREGDCQSVEQRLLAIMQDLHEANRHLDERTQHGRLDGARFPADNSAMASR